MCDVTLDRVQKPFSREFAPRIDEPRAKAARISFYDLLSINPGHTRKHFCRSS